MRPEYVGTLTINKKKDNDVTIFRHDVIVKLFWGCRVSLVTFSYWSKFHISIMTGSWVMTIFVNKEITTNRKIRYTHSCFLPNISRLDGVKDTTFGANVSNKQMINVAKCQGYSFYRFWVIKGKPTETILPSPSAD